MQPTQYVEIRRTSPRFRKKRTNPFLFIMVVLFVAAGLGGAYLVYLDNLPNEEHVTPYAGIQNPTLIAGELSDLSVIIQEGKVLLPFSLVKSAIDPYIFWDEKTQSVLITTENKVLQLPNQQLQAFVNEEPFQLAIPVQKEDDEIFVPFDPLKEIYPFQVQYIPETGVTLIDKLGMPIQQGVVIAQKEDIETRPIREDASIKSPIYADLPINSTVRILGEKAGWYWVMSDKGITGYMKKEDVQLSNILVTQKPVPERSYTPWNPLGSKINLTWEHVVTKNPRLDTIPNLSGLNVISPTWFEIIDEQGNIATKADLEYVRWAHERGYQVWGLISNGFNPDRTHAFLSDYETRKKIIRQMIEYAHIYELDGYNLDFENVYLKDKELLVQFVRELTPYLHEQDLVVSIDVTVKSLSENWSLFYDRKALGEVVDYMAVMTYDEHWASSPVAGSVASLPWVEKGLKGILEEVPAHKILLGVPYYTRLWKESKDENGKTVVTQTAYSMEKAKAWLAERGITPVYDEKTGQHYAEYFDADESATYKIWLEDAESMRKRAELVKKYDLAGIASWRRGFETEEIWTVIEEVFTNRP